MMRGDRARLDGRFLFVVWRCTATRTRIEVDIRVNSTIRRSKKRREESRKRSLKTRRAEDKTSSVERELAGRKARV